MRQFPRITPCVAFCGLVALTVACDSAEEPTPSEALGMSADEKFRKEQYKPSDEMKKKLEEPANPLAPPTAAEFKAWDRKDPEGEKHLYKWDKQNSARMLEYWQQLQCYRDKVRAEGEKAFGSEPQSPEDEQWYQFKRMFIPFVNRWQQRLFANEPRILEKSKYISNILEAHELVMNGYPDAFNSADKVALQKVDAHWLIVEDKVKNYTDQIGAKWTLFDTSTEKGAEKKAKFCEKAMIEPKKDVKKVKKKTSI